MKQKAENAENLQWKDSLCLQNAVMNSEGDYGYSTFYVEEGESEFSSFWPDRLTYNVLLNPWLEDN